MKHGREHDTSEEITMLDFASSPFPQISGRIESILTGSGCRHAVIEDRGDHARLTFAPGHNRMHATAGIQGAIREGGLVHIATKDLNRGDIVIEFARTMPIRPGFHVLADCDTRSHVVAMFDGTSWWMPGSDLAFPDSSVARKDGTNAHARFQHVQAVAMPKHAYGAWKPENGRFH